MLNLISSSASVNENDGSSSSGILGELMLTAATLSPVLPSWSIRVVIPDNNRVEIAKTLTV